MPARRLLVCLLVRLSFAVAATVALPQPATAGSVEDFDSIQLFTLSGGGGIEVKVTNYGATVTSIVAPGRDGERADVALGYDRVEDYINAVDKPYFGAIVGRYGNRIAGGAFTLDGQTYELLKNNGPNHLHGGAIGFDKVVWDADFDADANRLALTYVAKDGEEGYPGNLTLTVTYAIVDGDTLDVRYEATTDAATPVNVTQHTYFNLAGEGAGDVLGHELMLNATRFTPVDETLIPTGELRSVDGTPLDFRTAKPIGRDIDADDEQIAFGLGYDHNWVLDRSADDADRLTLAARVVEPSSGRTLTVRTTEPGVQFYTGNFLDGRLTGKSGRTYGHRGGFCLETQHFPDSPNQPSFPSTILRPGETMTSRTTFTFGIAD